MGASQDKPLPPPTKQPDPMDMMLDMKMTAKRFERESNKAEKEKKKQMEKAKKALAQGNEEGAKLFLQNAQMKQNESLNLLKMAHKMEAIQCTIKQNMSSQQMMQSLNRLTPYLQHHATTVPIEQIYGDMQNFEQAMDEVTVSNKIVTQAVNVNSDPSQSMAVDDMLQQMKQEQMNQVDADLNLTNQQMYNQLQGNQQQMQQQQQQQQYQNPQQQQQF